SARLWQFRDQHYAPLSNAYEKRQPEVRKLMCGVSGLLASDEKIGNQDTCLGKASLLERRSEKQAPSQYSRGVLRSAQTLPNEYALKKLGYCPPAAVKNQQTK